MEYIIFFAVIFFILSFVFIKGVLDNIKDVKTFTISLKEKYGNVTDKYYSQEQIKSIATYFRKYREDDCIDDITWNDLSMDDIFMSINHTYSSAGEECLYHLLRCPKYTKEEIEKQEDLVRYFMENEKDRIRLQVQFAKIGKSGKYSIHDYLDYLGNLGEQKNFSHYLTMILFIAAVMVFGINASAGITFVSGVICYNITTYFKFKREIEPYITTFAYILRILKASGEIEKCHVKKIEPYIEEINVLRKKFTKFSRNSFLVTSRDGMTGGNPLEVVLDYLRMMFHLDIIKFNFMLKQIRNLEDDVCKILHTMGAIEAAIAIGGFRQSLDVYCIPEFTDVNKKQIYIQEGYHPLIKQPVVNTIEETSSVLITGSNASGKSTFLKMAAINAILAQTVNTCTASAYRACFYRIYSSMALRDNLLSKESYYIVEIKSLKRILDAMGKSEIPVLCFVDEVLRGTNTVERIAASTQILKAFADEGIMCFAATHDIELTQLLRHIYQNYHFEEDIIKDDIVFNYELKHGAATTRNAIKLLGMLGYDASMIDKASKLAESFLENGVWDEEID